MYAGDSTGGGVGQHDALAFGSISLQQTLPALPTFLLHSCCGAFILFKPEHNFPAG
jgi:hypothetical protein